MKKWLHLLLLLLFVHGMANGQTTTDTSLIENKLAVYTFVERMPEYPGGDKALIKFVKARLRYPAYERNHGIEGRVMIRFVVMEDGNVEDVHVVKSVTPAMDAEAVRVVKMLRQFKPGLVDGRLVRVYYNLPLSFKLDLARR